MTRGSTPVPARRVTFADVVGVREFRVLWLAQTQSRVGDQLARVALTLLPPLISGPLLAGLADRLPRRTLMVATDTVSAVLVAVMAVPGMPLRAMIVPLAVLVGIPLALTAVAPAVVSALVLWTRAAARGMSH